MKVISSHVIYENPLPQLRSRHAFFPSLCELDDGTLAAVYAVGQAFESVDSTTCISFSRDGGKSWSAPAPLFDKSRFDTPITDYGKITRLPDGRLIVFGYAYLREDEELPIGNPETGGLLDDFIFYSISEDNGLTWGDMIPVPCSWGPHVEASAPLYLLADGTWITPITGFPAWDGKMTGPMCGRALRSSDGGKSWEDDAVCMQFETPVTCYEQRMCVLASGTIVNIGWNEDTVSGTLLKNHITYSTDNGKTWSAPMNTGVGGQASSLLPLGGEKFLSLHAVRRNTDRPGIYAYVIDFSNQTWQVIDELVVWEPTSPLTKNNKMAEIFSFLKFGQPSAILLSDGDLLMTHWYEEMGQYKTLATRISLSDKA